MANRKEPGDAMELILQGHGLVLSYLSETAVVEALDQERIYEDLAEGAYDALVFRPERWRLADHDHLVLAQARRSGQYLGLLAASETETEDGPFLNIDTAFVAPAAQSLDLFQRMLALLMLRIEGITVAPSVVTACTGNVACLSALRGMAGRCPGAILFPQTDAPVVALGTAALARRLVRHIAPRARLDVATGQVPGPHEEVLAVLDLRACPPDSVVEVARMMCRARPRRVAWRQALGAPAVKRIAAGR
jgi:hypothetical protein